MNYLSLFLFLCHFSSEFSGLLSFHSFYRFIQNFNSNITFTFKEAWILFFFFDASSFNMLSITDFPSLLVYRTFSQIHKTETVSWNSLSQYTFTSRLLLISIIIFWKFYAWIVLLVLFYFFIYDCEFITIYFSAPPK
jgi:hypothetical protein